MPVAEHAEVGERFLRRAELAFAFGEFVAEGDEEAAEALALVLWQGKDAGHVVAFGGFLFLGEIAHQVAAVGVAGAHAVEEKRVDVVVEGFVVEEEFGEEAEVAAPGALAAAIDFEEGDAVVAVDFVSGRVGHGAFAAVAFEGFARGEVREAELVDVDYVRVGEFLRVRREVPRFHFVFAHLDAGEVADQVELGMVLDHGASGAEFFDFLFWVGEGVKLLDLSLHDGVAHLGVAVILRKRSSRGCGCRRRAGQCRVCDGEKRIFRVFDVFAVLLATCFGRSGQFAVIATLCAKKIWCS